nr:CopG family transcriptional regulator [Caballeronia sp. GAWG1-1]
MPDSQVNNLAAIAEAQQRPRATVIRDAIEAYIAQRRHARGADVSGFWEDKRDDGLTYQQQLRSAWRRRSSPQSSSVIC